MKLKIAIASFCTGLLFFCFYQDWIIFTKPFKRSDQITPIVQKKEVTLYFLKNNNSWHQETTTILWKESTAQKAHELLNHWFLVGDDEELIPHKVTVLQCALSHNKTTLFVTLDRSPFDLNNSLQQKMMLLEGLLKTIRENKLTFSSLFLLVNNKPLQDQQLNFENPLPITGFFEK